MRGATGQPTHIHIERIRKDLWRFEVLNSEGKCIDYSLGSRLGLVWRMAKRAFRHAERHGGAK